MSSRDPRARRANYLRIASRLFAQHGFAGTSTDMIVAKAGGSKATLYKYFPSKESLIVGLIEQVVERAYENVARNTFDDAPLRDALVAIGRGTLDAVVSDGAADVLRLCLGEYHRFPELARAVWNHGPAITYARFREFLEMRHARKELDVADPQLAAEHFLAAIAGHIQLKVAMGIAAAPDDAERSRRVDAAVETFLARYATPLADRDSYGGAAPSVR